MTAADRMAPYLEAVENAAMGGSNDAEIGALKAALEQALVLLNADPIERAGDPDCDHEWVLTEEGYTRTWSAEVDGDRIIATYGGSDDWSDEGDGREYLECLACSARQAIDGREVVYR